MVRSGLIKTRVSIKVTVEMYEMSLLCQLLDELQRVSPPSSTNSSGVPSVVTENARENLSPTSTEASSLIPKNTEKSLRQINRKYGEDIILSDCCCLSNCLFRISKCNSKANFKISN